MNMQTTQHWEKGDLAKEHNTARNTQYAGSVVEGKMRAKERRNDGYLSKSLKSKNEFSAVSCSAASAFLSSLKSKERPIS